MDNKNKIQDEVQFVSILGDMVTAYEEIYVVKMRKVRDKVLSNRQFMEGLTEVFAELKGAYVRKIKEENLSGTKYSEILKKQKQSVAVLLSAKRKLSGDINQRVFSEFNDFIHQNPDTDVVVVGAVGRDLFTRVNPGKEFKYFDMAEDEVDIVSLRPVLENILMYDKAMIFYGRYSSLVTQKQTRANIRGNYGLKNVDVEDKAKEKFFIFEPSLEELLVFFENQIFASLYKQTAHESYLAQVGSRIQTLQAAADNVEKRMQILNQSSRKLDKRKRNKRQLQGLAGMRLWNVR